MRGCLGWLMGTPYAFFPGLENAGRGNAVPKDELLMAVNARLQVFLDYFDSGRIEDAVQLVRRMHALLPPPERRHLEAARNTHRHDQPDA